MRRVLLAVILICYSVALFCRDQRLEVTSLEVPHGKAK